MTDPNRGHVFLVVDRSGSMSACREATQDGINEFFNGQKSVPKQVTASLFQFDDEHDTVFAHVQIGDVPEYKLKPRGMTALFDAVGYAFTREGEWLASLPEGERPGTVVAVIATDGQENSSLEWDGARIRELITQQREVYGWEILFIGANMDAVEVGADMGIRRGQTMTYVQTDGGTRSAYGSVTSVVGRSFSRRAAAGPVDFSDADRAAAMGEDPGRPGE